LVPSDQRFAGSPRCDSPVDRCEYYAARAIEARRLAKEATSHAIELIHLEMALRYDLLARLYDEESVPVQMAR